MIIALVNNYKPHQSKLMKNLLAASFILTLVALSGCKQGDRVYQKGKGDFYYKIITKNGGATIQPDNFVWLYYTGKTNEGKKISGSFLLDNRAIEIAAKPPQFTGDFYTGLRMLSEGDSASFKINIDSLLKYKEIEKKPVTKDKYLYYTVKVYKVITRGSLNDDELHKKLEEENSLQIKKAKELEPIEISHYLVDNKIPFKTTPAGMYYYVNKPGSGPKAANGDTVLITYTVRTLINEVAETNDKGIAEKAGLYDSVKTAAAIKELKNEPEGEEEIQYILSKYKPTKVILTKEYDDTGLNQALKLFPEGTVCTLLLPSKLTYKGAGHKGLAPYTPILCNMEILSVKKQKK